LLGSPFGSTPVVALVVLNEPVESPDSLLHGDSNVRPVGKDDIDSVQLEVLQTLQSTLDDVLPAQSFGVVRFLPASTEEDFGGDDVVSSIPAGFFEDSAHLDLGFTGVVALGGVKHVDTSIPSSGHELLDDIALVVVSDSQPSSITENWDSKTSLSESTEDHVLLVKLDSATDDHFG